MEEGIKSSLEEIIKEWGIHIHLHKLVHEIDCPSSPDGKKVIVYLARQRFDPTKVDVKYYYNCNKALACTEEVCIFKKSLEYIKERGNQEASENSERPYEAFYSQEEIF
ncbi:hypothetical protein DRN63_04570 [Nanoarchaeota archaeon]|nr:MAG: hypothetical protein DRN63_04570 [Nanoarchaeota archaeon]